MMSKKRVGHAREKTAVGMKVSLAPQNIEKTRLDLLEFLAENEIRFCRVLTEEMKEFCGCSSV
ncbi:MAG: hypothetical protein KKE57_03010 [Proteobacteria bacterium]|nr:hypothetical protein [Pseudomonadota bacterium]